MIIQFLGYLPEPPREPHKRFRFYRQALGLSVKELAMECRISHGRISQIEAGRAKMDEGLLAWLEEWVKEEYLTE